MLEKTEVSIKNWQSRETGIIGYTRRSQTKHKHNTICVWHRYPQTKTNNVNKTWSLLQTTGRKDEPNIVSLRKPYNIWTYLFFKNRTIYSLKYCAKTFWMAFPYYFVQAINTPLQHCQRHSWVIFSNSTSSYSNIDYEN